MRPAIDLPPLTLGMKTRVGINLKTRLGITPSGVRLATRDNRRTKRGPTRDTRHAARDTRHATRDTRHATTVKQSGVRKWGQSQSGLKRD